MPKLKVGDTFVLTKEMAAHSKKLTDIDNFINTELTVIRISESGVWPSYLTDTRHIPINSVDLYLPEPTQPKSPKRTWAIEFKSSDGIEIGEGEITIKIKGSVVSTLEGAKMKFTESELTTLANQIRAAKLQLKKLK